MPTALQAISIGSRAAQELSSQKHRVVGEITNTFPNSFYLKTVNNTLLLVTNRHVRSPITVNLDSTTHLDRLINPHDQLYVHGQEIRTTRGVTINLQEATVYESPSMFVGDVNSHFVEISESLRLAAFVLGIIDTSRSVLDPKGFGHEDVMTFVHDGILSLRSDGSDDSFQHAAMKIVGLGYGFTPSGDDLLGGYLAAYNSFTGSIKRKSIILDFTELLERTSWISATLLDNMQRLVLDEQLREIFDCAVRGCVDVFVEAIEALLARGHTSGIDLSTGIILALSLIRDLVFEKKETESIAARLGLLTQTTIPAALELAASSSRG